MIAAKKLPSMRCRLMFSTAASMNTDWSLMTCVLTSLGRPAWISRRRCLTSVAVATVFSPDCFATTSVTAGTPSRRAAVRGSS